MGIDIISEINEQYEILLKSSRHQCSSLANMNDFYENYCNIFKETNNNYKNLYSKYLSNQIELDSSYTNYLISNILNANNKSYLYELHSINKNNDILCLLEKHYNNLQEINENINKDIVNSTKVFHTSITKSYQIALDELRSLIIKSSESSKNLDKLKSKYFEYYYILQENKKDIKSRYNIPNTFNYNTNNNNNNNNYNASDSFYNKKIDYILKLEGTVQVIYNHLKYDIEYTNKVYEECERKYNSVYEIVRSNEESRRCFILRQENKFSKYLIEIGDTYKNIGIELKENILNLFKKEIVSNNLSLYDNNIMFNDIEENSGINIYSKENLKKSCKSVESLSIQSNCDNKDCTIKKLEFIKENILDIEKQALTITEKIFQKNLTEDKNNEEFNTYTNKSSEDIKEEYNKNINSTIKSDSLSILSNVERIYNKVKVKNTIEDNCCSIFNECNDDFNNLSYKFESETQINKKLNMFWNNLLSTNDVDINELRQILKIILYDDISLKALIDIVLPAQQKNVYYVFKNLNNLRHLSCILNTIIVSKYNYKEDNHILFAIIYISERIYFKNEIDTNNNLVNEFTNNDSYNIYTFSNLSLLKNGNLIKTNKNINSVDYLNDKIYLCALMSENKIYSSKVLWKDLFLLKYKTNIEEKLIKIYPKLIAMNFQNKDLTTNNNIDNNQNNNESINWKYDCNNNTSIIDCNNKRINNEFNIIFNQQKDDTNKKYIDFNKTYIKENYDIKHDKKSNLLNKLKNIFGEKKEEVNINNTNSNNNIANINDNLNTFKKGKSTIKKYINPKTSVIQGINNFAGFINNEYDECNNNFNSTIESIDIYMYENLEFITCNPNMNQENLIYKLKIEESTKIIRSFINHFANYDIDLPDAIEFVVDICTKLNFPKEYLSLFVTLINTSIFTIKNKQFNFNYLKLKIYDITSDENINTKKKRSLSYNNNKMLNLTIKSFEVKSFVFSLCYKYISIKEYFKLLLLNKSFYKKLKKEFCAVYLNEECNIYKDISKHESNNDINKSYLEVSYDNNISSNTIISNTNKSINSSQVSINNLGSYVIYNNYPEIINNNSKEDSTNIFTNFGNIDNNIQTSYMLSPNLIKTDVVSFMKKRIVIWKRLLNTNNLINIIEYNDLSNLLNYLQENSNANQGVGILKKEINKDNIEKLSTNLINNNLFTPDELKSNSFILKTFDTINFYDIIESFNIINLDVVRTYFSYDIEKSRKVIENVLKCFVLYKNSKVYCQGMNYIISFLYLVTNDERDTFYLFLGLYDNTDFQNIFLNDLAKLKQFFYIFDRLLILYTPELNSYFYHNSIGSSFYCSPWFMTLFTNCYQTVDNRLSYILIKVWDEFVVNGWHAVLKTAIVLFMSYEKLILKLKYEDMLNFLFNEVLRLGFFNNDNYLKFISLWNKINFPKDLLSNLENEYIQGCKMLEISEKNYKDLGY